MQKIEIYGRRGDGSDMAEAFLTLAHIPYEFISLDYDTPGPDRDRLLALNVLGQVPTLRLPDGKILTECLAIAVYAQTLNPDAPLIPREIELVPKFWRTMTMLVAAIYPTFTYGDDPAKWAGEAGAARLRETTEERRKVLWRFLEKECGEPYFLGSRMTAIDVALRVMTTWRPREAWFEKETPRLFRIRERMDKDPRIQKIWN